MGRRAASVEREIRLRPHLSRWYLRSAVRSLTTYPGLKTRVFALEIIAAIAASASSCA